MEQIMDEREQTALKQRFQQAIDQFVAKIKDDVNVIAVIVGGSMAYDLIWEKSDVDMTVIVRDQPLKGDSLSIVEDGITLNVYVATRSSFKRWAESAVGGSFLQSYLAKGKIVYSTDESLYDYYEDLKQIGEDDMALTALRLAGELIGTMHKAQKWLTVRRDTMYSQYFLLFAAELIAHMELSIRGIPTSRSAIQKAIAFNPEIMQAFYHDLMAHLLSESELAERIHRLDGYIEERMALFQKPVLEYLANGEIKTTATIARHLRLDSHFAIEVLNYLTEKGVIDKVSQLIKLTPKSRLSVEEIGFMYIPH
jgi:predicted nucleotidyltransferase